MSLNQIYDLNNNGPFPSSNLNVNSIKTKSLSYILPSVGSVQHIYLDPAGSDSSNSGLSSSSPLLTFKMAVTVAQNYSAELCQFNLQGTGNISGFRDCNNYFGLDKILDLRPLVTNYSSILIKGYRTDEINVVAGAASETTIGPNNTFIQLNNFSGLAFDQYRTGFLNSGNSFDTVYFNQSTYVQSTRPIGFAAAGFSLYNLGSVEIFDDSKWGIASFLPVTFQDVVIASPTTSGNYIENAGGLTINMHACHLKNQKVSDMIKGSFDFVGCAIEGMSVGGNYSFVDQDSVINLHNCQLRDSFIGVSDAPEWRALWSDNSTIALSSATYDIEYWEANNSYYSVLTLSESKGSLDNVFLFSSLDNPNSTVVQCHSSSIESDTYIEVIKNLDIQGLCVNLTNKSHLEIGGDCSIVSYQQNSISLSSDSSMTLSPQSDGINIIKSDSDHAISIINNSSILINEQNTRNIYEIRSSGKEAIFAVYNSFINVNTPQVNGPGFYSPLGFNIANIKYDSTIRFADANYVNYGSGLHSVLLGSATAIATNGGPGDLNKSAIDVVLGAALSAGQNCIITFGAV